MTAIRLLAGVLSFGWRMVPLIFGSPYFIPSFSALLFSMNWLLGYSLLFTSLLFITVIGSVMAWKEFTTHAFRASPHPDGNDTCLITGSSKGIGFEIAKLFARDGFNLILVARDQDELFEARFNLISVNPKIKVYTIAKDLGDVNAPREIFNYIMTNSEFRGLRTRYLVNNAGFALRGEFLDMDHDEYLRMLDVNDKHVVSMCYYFGNKWQQELKTDRSISFKIMNLSSAAALLATPYQAVYSATKSFIHTFSLALHEELDSKWRGRFTVTALCPSFTETDLIPKIGAENANAIGLLKAQDTASRVAKVGYKAMFEGDRYIVVGWVNNLMYWILTMMPVAVLLKVMKFLIGDVQETFNLKVLQKGVTVERGNYGASEISAQ